MLHWHFNIWLYPPNSLKPQSFLYQTESLAGLGFGSESVLKQEKQFSFQSVDFHHFYWRFHTFIDMYIWLIFIVFAQTTIHPCCLYILLLYLCLRAIRAYQKYSTAWMFSPFIFTVLTWENRTCPFPTEATYTCPQVGSPSFSFSTCSKKQIINSSESTLQRSARLPTCSNQHPEPTLDHSQLPEGPQSCSIYNRMITLICFCWQTLWLNWAPSVSYIFNLKRSDFRDG